MDWIWELKNFGKNAPTEVYDQLRDKITSQGLRRVISLRELAAKFGVISCRSGSLVAARSEKIIVIESNKIHVNTLSAKEMEEALRLRVLLESMAAERACDLRPESEIPRLKRLIESMEASTERPRIYMRKNNLFHFSIYSHSDSPLLLEIIGRLRARVGPYVYSYAISTHSLSYTMKCHWEMFEALRNRDKEKINAAVREDLETTARMIIPSLEKPSSRRPPEEGTIQDLQSELGRVD
jgi:DNA-binding GntR family transcriptional regulator